MKLKPTSRPESGVALVITLILMSVTLLMALAFLFISRREQGSVTTQTDSATARLAADAALANAESQIIANTLASAQPNPYGFGPLVSTNFINPNGFQAGVADYNNVNYLYALTGTLVPANAPDYLQLLANMYYLPRLPVLLSPNEPQGRYYLDLNRNGFFETTFSSIGDPQWVGILERPDVAYGVNNRGVARYAFIALPVGNTLDLNALHNQAHRGLPSLPVDPTVNPPQGLGGNHDDIFMRNEGVGSWELNFAAFLADLNTNQWGRVIGGPLIPNSTWYYYQDAPPYNHGNAFDNSREILAYRYANNFNTLDPAQDVMANNAAVFGSDQIDGFTYGIPQMTGFQLPADNDAALIGNKAPWVGSDNTNHFFNLPTELFDQSKTATGVSAGGLASGFDFTSRLLNAGSNNVGVAATPPYDDYDHRTLYRLLSQLSTDSRPESDKVNVNYDNLDAAGRVIPNYETNFIAWTPARLFTNAADRMLRMYTARWAVTYMTNSLGFAIASNNAGYYRTFHLTNSFGLTGIPVWVSNQFVYTPAVQRILQLAANISDATGTNAYPSVFRPIFTIVEENGNTNVYITGYTNLNRADFVATTELADPDLATPVEIGDLVANYPAVTETLTNVYGVPWIIGAKKGFPNFNEFAVQSSFQLSRKLAVYRNIDTSKPYPAFTGPVLTNQMYLMSLTNHYGLECWYSYRAADYPGQVSILVRCSSTVRLTNDNNLYGNTGYFYSTNFAFVATTPFWPKWDGTVGAPQVRPPTSFLVPLNTSVLALTNTMYVYNEPNPPNDSFFAYVFTNPTNYYDQGIRQFPHFTMLTTNRLQVAIIDYSQGLNQGRIVDYAQLGGLDSSRDLNAEIAAVDTYHFFATNYDSNGNLYGVAEQIRVSQTGQTFEGQTPPWPATPGGLTAADQRTVFNAFFSSTGLYNIGGTNYYNTLTNMQAPYTPSVTAVQHTSWQANDPLIHYVAGDLGEETKADSTPSWPGNLGQSNDRYLPWNRKLFAIGADDNGCNPAFKDPLVYESGDWNFPTSAIPTIGWLGRVHRGTPWQTVYLKSTNILAYTKGSVSGITTWIDWTGNGNLFDVTNTAPVEDRLLFDLFTTAFNDNASRGQLSVNVGAGPAGYSLAAWSALLSGVTVAGNTNAVSGSMRTRSSFWPRRADSLPITLSTVQPAGPYTPALTEPPLYQIASSIDTTRSTFKNRDGLVGVFEHTGDILSAPLLSDQSPYLNRGTVALLTNSISDEMYEWLPQQVMSLLTLGAQRYVIYSWGQALKPAPNGIFTGTTTVSGGQSAFGMVTNYQVVAESATRAVVRIEGAPTNTHVIVESFNILPPD